MRISKRTAQSLYGSFVHEGEAGIIDCQAGTS
jgi:hypothetical protein